MEAVKIYALKTKKSFLGRGEGGNLPIKKWGGFFYAATPTTPQNHFFCVRLVSVSLGISPPLPPIFFAQFFFVQKEELASLDFNGIVVY